MTQNSLFLRSYSFGTGDTFSLGFFYDCRDSKRGLSRTEIFPAQEGSLGMLASESVNEKSHVLPMEKQAGSKAGERSITYPGFISEVEMEMLWGEI